MSLPNPINVTYVSPLITDTFPFQYIVKDTDNIINIDSTHGEVHVILRNIRNSGMLQYQSLLSINDGGNNASVNNITIYPSEGDVINDNTEFVLNNDGANSIIQISDINQWVVSSSQPSEGGGGGIQGTDYVFVSGNGTPEENAIELQAAYDLAKIKVDYRVIQEPTNIDSFYYFGDGYLDIPFYYYSEYGGFIEFNVIYELIFDGVSYFASASNPYSWVWVDDVYPTGFDYTTLEIVTTVVSFNLISVIVATGRYSFDLDFVVDSEYVSIVSLTGNTDVLFTGNGTINVIGNGAKVKGINLQDKPFKIATNLNLIVVENCEVGRYSFGGNDIQNPINISGTFKNCKAQSESFGLYGDASGVFENCIADYGSFGNLGTASGTFINCKGGSECFGYNGIASGVFTNCVGSDYSFGGLGNASGIFTNCVGGNNSFGSGNQPSQNSYSASGTFDSCQGGEYSFGSFAIASGVFFNCKARDFSFGANYTGNGVGVASGTFTNCIGGLAAFGRTTSGTFTNCIGGQSAFGILASGKFTNCVGGNNSFGETASGNFNNCIGGEYSFGFTVLSGKLYYCQITSVSGFQTVSGGGRTYYCVDGNGNVNNQ
jgi:hypothetical protein